MKKDSKRKTSRKAVAGKMSSRQICNLAAKQRLTVGLDLGDHTLRYCILDEAGEVASEGSLAMREAELSSLFGKMPSSRIALEAGTHSPWVSRKLKVLGHEVIVANPHKTKLITQSVRKNDRLDAQKLARLARADPKLLSPIQHRGEEAQADLGVIRARAELMEVRTSLINSARGLVKPMGCRLRACDADQVGISLAEGLPEAVKKVVGPLLSSVEMVSAQLRKYDQTIEAMTERYPEVKLLTQVYGVGKLIGLTYLLTIEDPERFAHSRDVGAYVGLQPKQRESGKSQPELSISKSGDELLRRYLVQAAHCILKKGGPESDLRMWGLKKAEGGKKAKRRAVVAVARKLGVMLHMLWVTGQVYDPLYNRKKAAEMGGGRGKTKTAA